MDATDIPPQRVLLVEDDVALASVVERALAGQGHDVEHVARGDEAVAAAAAGRFDVVVLDVMLPGLDGIAACRRMREVGVDASIIMLTARGTVDDRIEGLDAGADDYLVKPFSLKELYARIRSNRRREVRRDRAPMVVGDLVLLVEEHACERRGDRIELRPKELAILEHLMRNAGLVVERASLLEAAWGEDAEHQSNAIDAQLLRLRAKVDRPYGGTLIETVRGVGYRLRRDG